MVRSLRWSGLPGAPSPPLCSPTEDQRQTAPVGLSFQGQPQRAGAHGLMFTLFPASPLNIARAAELHCPKLYVCSCAHTLVIPSLEKCLLLVAAWVAQGHRWRPRAGVGVGWYVVALWAQCHCHRSVGPDPRLKGGHWATGPLGHRALSRLERCLLVCDHWAGDRPSTGPQP